MAKEKFVKSCLRHLGNLGPGAVHQKVVAARAKFLYKSGKMLQAYPQAEVAVMKRLNEIEVAFATELMAANALSVLPAVLHDAPEIINTIPEPMYTDSHPSCTSHVRTHTATHDVLQ